MEKAIEQIDEMIETIKDKDVKSFTREMVLNYCMKTFKKKTSSTDKYHPSIANTDWGVLHHTKLTLIAAEKLMTYHLGKFKLADVEADIIRAACILHDGWKYETRNGKFLDKFTSKDHGYTAMVYLKKEIEQLGDKNTNTMATYSFPFLNAVRFHMTEWCHNDDERSRARMSEGLIIQIVAQADLIASERKLIDYEKIEFDKEHGFKRVDFGPDEERSKD